MEKFTALNVSHLRIDDLGGLATETVVLATPKAEALSDVAAAMLDTLTTTTTDYMALMGKHARSLLTPKIREKDKLRDDSFAEIKRTSKSAQKSSTSFQAECGTILVELLRPFWNIDKEPYLTQASQINALKDRFFASGAANNAAMGLLLLPVFMNLFDTNTDLLSLYNQREEELAAEGAAPISLKKDLVAAYDAFCGAVEINFAALPAAALQTLFKEMNDIRHKYITHLPTKLTEKNTTVDPIDRQAYTGAPVTPLPHVHVQKATETVELEFGKDFEVTYHNNVKAGQARLTVHGKGKYAGSRSADFYIA
jgi:hypothetical protein